MLNRIGAALGFVMLFAGSAYSQSLPEPSPEQPISGNVDFICYMETSDGQILDLTKVCDTGRIRTPSAPAATPPRPNTSPTATSPATNLGGLVSGQSGSALCFGVDAQGRACPFSPVTQE
jgi:hypothetical protein